MPKVSSPPQTIQLLILDRIDGDRNTARYSVLSVEAVLFGAVDLARQRERISPPIRQTGSHAAPHAAGEPLASWLQRKQILGYKLRSNGLLYGLFAPSSTSGVSRK